MDLFAFKAKEPTANSKSKCTKIIQKSTISVWSWTKQITAKLDLMVHENQYEFIWSWTKQLKQNLNAIIH